MAKMGTRELMKKMGDRAFHAKPPSEEKKSKKRDASELDEIEPRKKKAKKLPGSDKSVLQADVDTVYRPQTRETRAAYEVLLQLLQQELGDKPHDVLRSAAEEALAVLKDDKMKQKDRQRELEALVRRPKPMDEDRFAKFVNVANKITDFKSEIEPVVKAGDEGALDEEQGVPVVFDEEEDEEDGDKKKQQGDRDHARAVRDDSDMDEEEEEAQDDTADLMKDEDDVHGIESKVRDALAEEAEEEERANELDPRSIDAFWIQRQVAPFYQDALTSQKTAEEILTLLSSDEPDGGVENSLVQLVGLDHFAFLKLLLRNRAKVVCCITLARAKNEEERADIEKKMAADAKLRPILDALHKTSTAAERSVDLEKALRKEARNLGVGKKMAKTVEADVTTEMFWTRKPKAVIDFESIAFQEGGHTMSNTKVKLPKSEVINKKGYQEIHIPALKAPPRGTSEPEIKIESLPDWARPAFEGMTALNRIQSRVFDIAFHSPENMLLCAPTGAGKTNVAMLTILREMGLHLNSDGKVNLDTFKVVYVAPMKSLVQEMVSNFTKRLTPFGMTVSELSGDVQLSQAEIAATQVIVTTPEKWDIVTRKAGDRSATQLVTLMIIDEIHLLHDSRGPVLESLIARTIRQVEATQDLIRLVGLSATLPNYQDVAMFLRVKPDKGLFFFDNAFRPVPLQQQFIGVTHKKPFKRYEAMNQITYDKCMTAAGKHQVMVFVHSRKETATLARYLKDQAAEKDELGKLIKEDSARKELLTAEAANAKNDALKELLPFGFAIHHAGMTRADRTLVEELFADNHIQVLVCTATLAWGVNLPAHTVIIKGTQVYSPEKGKWTELSPLDVMQMFGRAGRPQYDDSGEGIIITTQKELQFYLSLLNEQLPIESQYLSRLADSLNAEIVLGTVSNVKEAVNWLGYTYLYIRMLRKPQLYGIAPDSLESDPLLEQRRIDLVHSAALILDRHGLVKYDRKTGVLSATELGRVASHYYLSYQTVATFHEHLKPTMSDIELFRVLSLSGEFKYMTVREEEKVELTKLLDKVPIPVKESIEEPSAKVNVLLQSYISRLGLEGFALMADMVYITQSAGRLMRALFEIALRRNWAATANKCLTIGKMINHRMWAAQSPLRQFKGIPADVIKRLEGKDFPWDRLYDLEAHAIGELVRAPKLGKAVHKAVHQLPRLELQGAVQPLTRSTLRVELTLNPDFAYDDKIHGGAEPFWVMVEDVDGETLLHAEFFVLAAKFSKDEHSLTFTVPVFDPLPPQYYVRVVSDRWLGSESVLPVSFRHLILPEKFAPPTELLDLQPLSITELANERFIAYFNGQFDYFNPIQTQCFNSVYRRDDNVLVAAPTGSGKTVLAELALMRMLSVHPEGLCVYVVAYDSLAKERYNEWSVRLGKHLGLSVVLLTGDLNTDLRLMADAHVVVTTPQPWDVVSRLWSKRPRVLETRLFIVDELHLIGGEQGPVIEAITSRMRFIGVNQKLPIRIMGLSTSVANAKDLGEWLTAPASCIFNFHPNVRPVPLEIRVLGFDMYNFHARQLAMIKPTYQQIVTHSPDKPAIVFVPSRKQARRVAVDLVTYASAEDKPDRFLHAKLEDLEPFLKNLSNGPLKESLKNGVGFYHSGLSDQERAIVSRLFKAGAIQVLVSEYTLCWGMTMSAHLVVVMGTQFFDGREHRYVDCAMTDVIQMVGRASRPQVDSIGKVTIMCHPSKKEFYKKFLHEPLPVESHFDQLCSDHINAEVFTKRVADVQEAVDYFTWTFYYRRLPKNPNYYNLTGVSQEHISEHLSDLVEKTLEDLTQAQCIEMAGGKLEPLNLGMVAARFYIKYTTVELFANSVQASSKLAALLDILSAASEFDQFTVKEAEDSGLEKLGRHLPLPIPDPNFTTPATKVNVLMQSHFARVPLTAQIKSEQDAVLPEAFRLLTALVDVAASKRLLTPTLACMEMMQMLVQGMLNTDSTLLQLPGFTKDDVAACQAYEVKSVLDFLDLDDEDRSQLLKRFSPVQVSSIALFANKYPDVEVKYQIEEADQVQAGRMVTVNIELARNNEPEEEAEAGGVPIASAPRYPKPKTEGWYLVVGSPKDNTVLMLRSVAIKNEGATSLKLRFAAPEEAGKHKLMLYLMCDSYMGVDQEHAIELNVAESTDMSDEDDE